MDEVAAGGWLQWTERHKLPDMLLFFTLHLFPQAAGHRCDQSGSLAAAVFRQQEGDAALRSQISDRLLHDPGETTQKHETCDNQFY